MRKPTIGLNKLSIKEARFLGLFCAISGALLFGCAPFLIGLRVLGLPDGGGTGGWLDMTSNKLLFHFNEAAWSGVANEIQDTSGAGNHGVSSGASISASGISGNAGSFNGLYNWLTISDSNSLDFTGGFTYSVWANPTGGFSNSSHSSLGLFDKGVFTMGMDRTDGKLHAMVLDSGAPSWSASAYNGTREVVLTMASFKGHLYAGTGISTNYGEVRACNPAADGSCPAANWVMSLPQATTGWDSVRSMVVYNGALYAGGGNSAGGSAEIRVCRTPSGASGECVNADWSANVFGGNAGRESVSAMAVFNGRLYAGTGYTASTDGTLWVCNPSGANGTCTTSDWTLVYDTVTSGSNNAEITALTVFKGNLYLTESAAGSPNSARVFVCVPTAAGGTQCGTSDWALSYSSATGTATDSAVSMVEYNGRLYASLADANLGNDFIVVCTPSGASRQCLPTDWTTSMDSTVGGAVGYGINTLATYGGTLYAGGQGGGAYVKIYACTLPAGGQCNTADWNTGSPVYTGGAPHIGVFALNVFGGRLYAGLGNFYTTANNDDVIYYGNTHELASTTSTWSANWHHVALTYDGASMRLYVDGTLENTLAGAFTPATNTRSLFIGKYWGGQCAGEQNPHMLGLLDEAAVFSRTLSASEIQTIYNTQHP